MTASAFLRVDKAEFYRFMATEPEGRFEFVRGRIMRQQGGTLRHAQIRRRWHRAIESRLPAPDWITLGADRGVDTGETVRYPDVVVERPGATADSLATHAPVLKPTSSRTRMTLSASFGCEMPPAAPSSRSRRRSRCKATTPRLIFPRFRCRSRSGKSTAAEPRSPPAVSRLINRIRFQLSAQRPQRTVPRCLAGTPPDQAPARLSGEPGTNSDGVIIPSGSDTARHGLT